MQKLKINLYKLLSITLIITTTIIILTILYPSKKNLATFSSFSTTIIYLLTRYHLSHKYL